MATQPQQPAGSLYNAITQGSKFIGNITADCDIRIDGILEGELKCAGKIIVGEKGSFKGTAACQNAEILGVLDGKLNVSQTLTLRASANLRGEVSTRTLIVEPKAIFNGTCSMQQSVETSGKK